MKKMTFKNSDKIGKVGEKAVKKFLKNAGGEFKDVSDVKKYQEMDVDFIHENKLIEVKSDRNSESGNIYVEIISNLEKNGAESGWLYKTKSDFIFYYFVNTGRLLIIPTNDLKEWLEKETFNFKLAECKTKVGRNSYSSFGKLVDISYMKTKIEVKDINIKGVK